VCVVGKDYVREYRDTLKALRDDEQYSAEELGTTLSAWLPDDSAQRKESFTDRGLQLRAIEQLEKLFVDEKKGFKELLKKWF
jgi:hypothetical protein